MEQSQRRVRALKGWVAAALFVALTLGGLAWVWYAGGGVQASPPAQPPIPHGLEGRADCLLCHGPGKPSPMPATHASFTNATCTSCHKGAAVEIPTPLPPSPPPITPPPAPTAVVTPPAGATTPAAPPAETPTPGPTGAPPPPTPPAAATPRPAATPGPTATPRPVARTQLNDFCLACHGNSDFSMALSSGEKFSLFVDRQGFAGSIHGDKLLCSDCHSRIQTYPHPEKEFATGREYTLTEYEACKRCHFANYTKTLDSIHYQALGSGVASAPVCVDCHDSHYVSSPNQPRTAVSTTCSQCHSKVYDSYAASVHGAALIDDDNLDVPVCTTCHGVHNIVDPTTTAFRYDIPQLCGSCHGDAGLMQKYGISTQVVTTYLRDFHGAIFSLRQRETPDIRSYEPACTDCHGTHDILRPDDAASPVMKENLVVTCQQCHSDAPANFPSAWLGHYSPSPAKNPAVFWLSAFYRFFMIPFIVGGLVIHILLDLWRVANRR